MLLDIWVIISQELLVGANSAEGELLVKIKPIRVIGLNDMARWLPINLTLILINELFIYKKCISGRLKL